MSRDSVASDALPPTPARTLVYENTGLPVKVGDKVRRGRGAKATVTGWAEPKHEGSTGRIHVREDGAVREYYPGVYGAKWVNQQVPLDTRNTPARTVTHRWAVATFKADILPRLPRNRAARSTAWAEYVDKLQKGGLVTEAGAAKWQNPWGEIGKNPSGERTKRPV